MNRFPKVRGDNWSEVFDQYIEIEADGSYVARFDDILVRSVYQPIYSYSEGIATCIGYEALMRAQGSENIISPGQFMNGFEGEDRYFLDRILRVLHILNFKDSQFTHLKLFLNADPYTCRDLTEIKAGIALLIDWLSRLKIRPDQIVFELMEHSAIDDDVFFKAVEYLREHGIQLAVDDYGQASSNIERVRKIKPDIVKLDRAWLLKAKDDLGTIPELFGNIAMLKEIGAEILIEGVEFEDDAALVRFIKPQYVQGYWYAYPAPMSFFETERRMAMG